MKSSKGRTYRRRPQRTGACGKIRYRDRVAALLALASINRPKPDGRPEEKRIYRCPACAGFHLTSTR